MVQRGCNGPQKTARSWSVEGTLKGNDMAVPVNFQDLSFPIHKSNINICNSRLQGKLDSYKPRIVIIIPKIMFAKYFNSLKER